MRIGNAAPLNGPEIEKQGSPVPPGRSSDASRAENTDKVALSPAGASALSNRSDRIAEIKTLVNSNSYTASSSDIGKKLVSEALSRPADQG
jgi:anti-sigma28 factor (negative regulator of flagellin synthesis)